MFDIITFGSAAQDILVCPRKLTSLRYIKSSQEGGEVCFPMGSKIDIEELKFYSGGGGTNSAATFSLQGFKTAYCGMIGDDFSGQKIIKELKELKIDIKLISITKERHTNHSIIIFNKGTDRTIFTYRGASELMEENNIPWGKIKTLLRPGLRTGKAKWIYLAPLTGLLCNNFEGIVNFASENKIKIAANPSMAQLSLSNFTDIVKKIDILIVNQEEASFLTKIPFEQEKEVFSKIDEIQPGIVIMTKGGEGVVVSDGKNIWSAKPFPERKVVDTTGAGDSFGSGFVAEFIRTTGDVEKSIQLGMANAISCLSEQGAKKGLLKKSQTFEKVKVDKEAI